MKKIVLMFTLLMTITTISAQEYNKPSDEFYGWGKYNVANFGMYVGYSVNNFLNIGGKLSYKEFSYLLEVGGNKSTKLGYEDEIFNDGWYSNNTMKMNTHTINGGFTYNVTQNFYFGAILGCGFVATTNTYKGNYDGVTERKYQLNNTLFNGGFVFGCRFNRIDFSIKYTNLENVSFRLGCYFISPQRARLLKTSY